MNWALINNGIVVNVIIADADFVPAIDVHYDAVIDVTDLYVGPGFTYDGTNFSPPPPEVSDDSGNAQS